MGRRLYVGNLPYSSSEDQLTELFSRAGKVDNVRVMRDMATGRARGFAFVEMSTDEEAQSCTSTSWMDGRWWSTKRDQSLKVDLAAAGAAAAVVSEGQVVVIAAAAVTATTSAGGAKNRGGKRQRAGSFEEPARCHVRSKARTARSAARSYSSTIQPSRS